MAVDYLANFKRGGISGASANARRTTTGKKKKATVSGEKTGQTYLQAPGEKRRYTAGGVATPSVAKAAPRTAVSSVSPVSAASVPNTAITGSGSAGMAPALAANSVTPAATTNANQDIMDQEFTGWAQGLKPDAAQMLFQEPQALLRQVLASMGMSANSNPGLYYQSLPNADLVNALSMLQLGGSSDFNQGNINSVINTMGDMFKQGATRGGTGIDFSSGLNNALTAGTGTALGDFLNLDDPRGQVQAMSSLLMPLAEAGLHPLFAQAFQAELGRLADEYYSRSAFGDAGGDYQDMLARRLNMGGIG